MESKGWQDNKVIKGGVYDFKKAAVHTGVDKDGVDQA